MLNNDKVQMFNHACLKNRHLRIPLKATSNRAGSDLSQRTTDEHKNPRQIHMLSVDKLRRASLTHLQKTNSGVSVEQNTYAGILHDQKRNVSED